jgi:hypothetical protein
VDFRDFATIRATVIDVPLKETKGWLQQSIYCVLIVLWKAGVVVGSCR